MKRRRKRISVRMVPLGPGPGEVAKMRFSIWWVGSETIVSVDVDKERESRRKEGRLMVVKLEMSFVH